MPRVRGGRYPATSTGRAYPNVGGVRGGRFPATNTGVQFPPAAAGGLSEDLLDWLVNIGVFETAISQTNWDTLAAQTDGVYAFSKDSSGAQNDQINFDISLAAGTWTFELIHVQSTDRGIYDVQIDGSSIGTIDGYAGSLTRNVRTQITSVNVAASGKVRLKLIASTKNASSSSYVGSIQHCQFKRTT